MSDFTKVLMFCLVLAVLCGTALACSKEKTSAEVATADSFKVVTAKDFTLSYKTEGDTLHCKLEGPTTGWVSLGIAPTSMMQDANFIIGYVDGGKGFIRDDFGVGKTKHADDVSLGGKSNVRLVSWKETEKTTMLEFRLPLSSGDKYDRELKTGESYKVIFGCGSKDDFKSYHSKKASAEMQL